MSQTITRGLLVVLEGIDGSGKSTLLAALASKLGSVVVTAEPTRGPHGVAIRRAFAEGRRLLPQQERELVEADRREHVASVIEPALATGATVLCDRTYYSTAAYQGGSLAEARRIVRDNEVFARRPDVIVFLDVAPESALARIHGRETAPTAPETITTLRACAERYESIWADVELMSGVRFLRVDARQPPAELLEPVLAAIGDTRRTRGPSSRGGA